MLEKIGEDLILVGTAHISKKSVDEVTTAIETYHPDVVAVELCKRRYDTLTKKDQWENTPITSLIRSNNAYYLLAQTFLSSIQRKLGKEHGVQPGSEMIEALHQAKQYKLAVELVDRDIAVTLKRAWKTMGFVEKFRVFFEFLKAMVGFEEDELEHIDIDELLDQDLISTMMDEFGKIAPSVTQVLIHERDAYIAERINQIRKQKKSVVAVVGAGHLNGIKKHLTDPEFSADITELEHVPKKRFSILKLIGYLIPVLFVVLIGYGFLTGGAEQSIRMFMYWFLINGVFSALGTLIARGHPLSILTAFVAAPITSLNPAIAAGWVAGYVEAKLRTPKIKDFQQLSHLESLSDFWKNRVIRLLLVVSLANVGSMIGTLVAFPYLTTFL
ncbi:MAG: TraB/GumN family protein [Candidatus Thermoplasmatota archaeon]|nr:TraB/GumN family protein [Candidatus Thermoplasmatota archaeon]